MLLDVQKVNKQFGGAVPVHVLKDVDLQMERGDFAALVGPSGAGKTTLLNLISTLDRPTSGQVMIDEVDVHSLAEKALNRFRNRHLGFIFQDDLLLAHLSALENVMMPGRIARKPLGPLRKMGQDLLGRVGLGDRMHHRPGELSGGQRQRVNLARALMNSPKLLLADEPTARLDSTTGQAIVEQLVELNEQLGVTILMVTHEHDVAEQARRIVEFLDGRVDVDRRTDAERKLGFRNA